MLLRRVDSQMKPLRAYFVAHGVLGLRQHGWVCEEHPDRPWRGNSRRTGVCDSGAGMPCECNAGGGIDEPRAYTSSMDLGVGRG
jgi:hypothetical protein